jgi:HSP20 family molecular chaperone IbpA
MSPHLIRVEDKIEDGHYVIRAEIPGIDPDKDVKITVEDDMLVIVRSEPRTSRTRPTPNSNMDHSVGR